MSILPKRRDILSFIALVALFYYQFLFDQRQSSLNDEYYTDSITYKETKLNKLSDRKNKGTVSSASLRSEQKEEELNKKPLPEFFDRFGDISEPFNKKENGDIPFFWHISRAGGSTVKDILGGCLGLVQASNVGVFDGHDADVMLKVVRVSGAKYLNVDTTSIEGIGRAKELGLADSGLLDVLVSHRFIAVSDLFTFEHRAKLFVMMRHPIDRAVSMFYYLSRAKWEKTYDPILSIYELVDYAKTNRMENNWMLRSLVNKMDGYLTMEDLDMAKEILRTKCLIGLLTKKQASMKRFQAYFGWTELMKKSGVTECEDRLLNWGWSNKNKHPDLEVGSEAYNLIKTKNELDILLYEYAEELFETQIDDIALADEDEDEEDNE